MLLDRHDHLDRLRVLARIFGAYIGGAINHDRLERFSIFIDRALIRDIRAFMQYYTTPERKEVNARLINSEFWQQFAEYGLSDVEVRVKVRRDGTLELSPYSKHLYEYRPGNDAPVLGEILVGDEFWH